MSKLHLRLDQTDSQVLVEDFKFVNRIILQSVYFNLKTVQIDLVVLLQDSIAVRVFLQINFQLQCQSLWVIIQKQCLLLEQKGHLAVELSVGQKSTKVERQKFLHF